MILTNDKKQILMKRSKQKALKSGIPYGPLDIHSLINNGILTPDNYFIPLFYDFVSFPNGPLSFPKTLSNHKQINQVPFSIINIYMKIKLWKCEIPSDDPGRRLYVNSGKMKTSILQAAYRRSNSGAQPRHPSIHPSMQGHFLSALISFDPR